MEKMEKQEEVIVEICCGSYYDVLQAYKGGAKRVELNSALHLGGLTASLGQLIMAKKVTNCKIIAMVRPRSAGFNYCFEEVETMMIDAELLLENGADGIAFGFLTDRHTVDKTLTKQMVELVHRYGKEAVFHRAFDCVADIHQSIKDLIECGVDRVLTSGQGSTVLEGALSLAQLQAAYGDQIEILAGCGVRSSNVKEILHSTGVRQVHSSCKKWKEDVTSMHNDVDFSYAKPKEYEVVSATLVSELMQEVEDFVAGR